MDDIIKERNSKYGNFKNQSKVAIEIKKAIGDGLAISDNWKLLEYDMEESLDMIANKISRIVNGDVRHEDSWRDIAGYATLVADGLKEEEGVPF